MMYRLLFVTLLFTASRLSAQTADWVIFDTTNSGLPGNHVTALAADSNIIWIGIDTLGLVKFNGANWTLYDTSNSGLNCNTVNDIAVDQNHVVWAATDSGLVSFDGYSWIDYSSIMGYCEKYLLSVETDLSGNTWTGTNVYYYNAKCGTYGCLAKYNGTNWNTYYGNDQWILLSVFSIAADNIGNTWVGTINDIIIRLEANSTWNVFYPSTTLPGVSFDSAHMAVDDSNIVWAGTAVDGKLIRTNGIDWLAYDVKNVVGSWCVINKVQPEADSVIWLGTNAGLVEFDRVASWNIWNTGNSSLPDSQITSIAIDGFGNKWVGMKNGGLAVYKTGGVDMPSLAFVLSHVSCPGGTDGKAIANPSVLGAPPYTFQWNDANSQTTDMATGLVVGTYQVIITDSNGMSTTLYATIDEPDYLSINTSLLSVCDSSQNNGSAVVTATGGVEPYTYSWTTGESTSIIENLSVGSYTVSVSDICGQVVTDFVELVNDPVITSITHEDAPCNGEDGSIDLSVTGGIAPYTYLWSNGAASEDLAAIYAGNYAVTITDSRGCEQMDVVTIWEPPELLLTPIISNVSCSGACDASIVPDALGGIPPYTYTWNPSVPLNNLCGNSSFGITVIDGINCLINKVYTVSDPGELVITPTISHAVIGNNNGAISLSISGGTAPYTYSWSTGANADSIGGIPGGFYTVQIIDAMGCADSASMEVQEVTGIKTVNGYEVFLKVLPNPFSNSTLVSVKVNPETHNVQLKVLDLSGRLVERYDISQSQTEIVLYGDDIGTGVFSIQLTSNNQVLAREKIVVLK